MTNGKTISTPTAETPGARTILRWLLAVLVVGAGLVVLSAWGVLILADRRTETQLNRLRDAGSPVSLAELEVLHPPLSRETVDANLSLQAAMSLSQTDFSSEVQRLMLTDVGESRLPPLEGIWAEKPQAEALLARYAGQLELLDRAAGFDAIGQLAIEPPPAAYFPLRSMRGGTIDFPHFPGYRKCLRLLQARLWVQLSQRDAEGAARTLNGMLRLGRSLENEPSTPGLGLRCAIDGITCDQLRLALSELAFTDDDLRGWQAELRTIDPQAAFRASLTGDRLLDGLPLIDPLAEDPNFDPDLMWRLSRGAKLQQYFDQADRLLDASSRSWVEQGVVEQTTMAQLPMTTPFPALPPAEASRMRLLSSFMTRSAVARWGADARGTDAVIAAELYHRRHGTFPKRLDDLVPDFLPAVPRDPFDGASLRFRSGDASCVIYSLGSNRRDDGGTTHDSLKGDLLYELRAPPAAVAP